MTASLFNINGHIGSGAYEHPQFPTAVSFAEHLDYLQIEPLQNQPVIPPKMLEQKPLWKRFRAGKPLDEVEIIDAHGHTPPHTRGWVMREQDPAKSVDILQHRMDSLGVNRIILSSELACILQN